ncbi:MAG: ACT domain-containing protein [Tissierellia bacterium]|nr:ACT domain-containing protein [Tissierellia bacterium]
MIKQLTVFIENRKGSLTKVTGLIKEAGINIISFSLADTENYGLLRMMVSDPNKAHEILKDNNISASLTEVTAVDIKNTPGTLHDLLALIESFDIQYMYVFSNRDDLAGVILKITEKEEAEKLIIESGFKLIEKEFFRDN